MSKGVWKSLGFRYNTIRCEEVFNCEEVEAWFGVTKLEVISSITWLSSIMGFDEEDRRSVVENMVGG